MKFSPWNFEKSLFRVFTSFFTNVSLLLMYRLWFSMVLNWRRWSDVVEVKFPFSWELIKIMLIGVEEIPAILCNHGLVTHRWKTKFTQKHDVSYSCLIKELTKMPKFSKFAMVNAIDFPLFRSSKKTFLDRLLNLLRHVTFWQNIFLIQNF